MLIPPGTMILVADGTHMLLLRNQGSLAHPDLKTIEHHSFANPPNRELASDAPGVVRQSADVGRSTYEEPSRHQENEDDFAVQTVGILNESVQSTDASVVVIAPPRTLAVLRDHYDKAVKEKLVAEIDKDLMHCNVSEIAERLMQFEP